MVKKRIKKFNIRKFALFIIIILLLAMICNYILNVKLKNIIVLGNNYYTDEEIIETSKLENYPKFIFINSSSVRKRLLKLDMIEDVKITKNIKSIITINIKEKKILYYDRADDTYMLSDTKKYKLDKILGAATLINYVPSEIESKFVNNFKNIDSNILKLISEIEYSKSEYDKERFLFTMNDGNQIYITINKLDVLNKYIDIVKKLDNKKGILYLDSGNYFEIKEK